jgi:hypothetical protein
MRRGVLLLIRVSLVRAQVEEPDTKSPAEMWGFFFSASYDEFKNELGVRHGRFEAILAV